MAEDIKSIGKVLQRVCNDLLKKQNVVATGIGYKTSAGERSLNLSIICSVEKKFPGTQLSSKDLVPKKIDGITTDVVETGRIRALNTSSFGVQN
ncbi:FIG00497627: hypothetical protein, partial [hydrothermal vent metagenome]